MSADHPAGRDPVHGDVAWLDGDAYPFETDCVDLSAGAMHYVDERPADGGRQPVLMLHGNPTWSFYYRHLIRGLRDEYRCVAPDYLGFGRSEKPADFSYRPAAHAATIAELVGTLGLSDVILVVHDWGGPIGLSYAIEHPENVRAVVLSNAVPIWPVDDEPHFRRFSWLAGGPIGRRACVRYNAFVRVVMPLAFADRSRFTRLARDHYARPLSDPADRTGTWVFPREVVGSTDWLRSLWARRDALATPDLPARILWGTEDPAMRAEERLTYEAVFHDPSLVRLRGVGHYVYEELGPDVVPYVREFLDDLDPDQNPD
jgi:haloalkane dehalogenase